MSSDASYCMIWVTVLDIYICVEKIIEFVIGAEKKCIIRIGFIQVCPLDVVKENRKSKTDNNYRGDQAYL